MKYHLSNRQIKELASGRALSIALPYPDQGIPGAHRHHDTTGHMGTGALTEWYRDSLLGEYDISRIAIMEVAVDPSCGRSEGGGLIQMLGNIVHLDNKKSRMKIRIVCVVANLVSPSRSPRSIAQTQTQWPGGAGLPHWQQPKIGL